MKLLAANLKAIRENNNGKEKLENLLTEKLLGYFKPEQLGRLVKRLQGRNRAEIELEIQGSTIIYNFATNTKNIKLDKYSAINPYNTLYLPPREIISVFEGFISLYQNRELHFDETYYQLALALDLPLLKGRRFDDVQALIKPLENITESKVIKENGRFYMQNIEGKMEMALVAEGYRKIATLMYLISNGEIAQNSILFWDEPEANLNPKLTQKVVELLLELAQKGVQIFLASHDYLLTNLLSLKSEYHKTLKNETIPPIQFFGLYEQDNQVACDTGNTLTDLSQNPILEEFIAFYDLEQRYFNQSIQD
ncbi:MAG: ATP-binding protein [Microscillaceae bacterium]|nr:ATP-binding protein [Microscillaceae bacterium]